MSRSVRISRPSIETSAVRFPFKGRIWAILTSILMLRDVIADSHKRLRLLTWFHVSRRNEYRHKIRILQANLRNLNRALIAYSGGVDSAYLAWAAHQALGDKMLAIIADSPSLARTQLADAIAFAREQTIPLEVITTSELDRPEYVRNDAQRCFFCKDELFTLMEELRVTRGFDAIAYGVNGDDQGDFRPGQKAASAHHIVAPLLDARLPKKKFVRSREAPACASGISRPPRACHPASNMAGPFTREALDVVEKGEDALRGLGFRQFRVRHHGDIVRIEIAREESERALDPAWRQSSRKVFKALGFKFVTLDLEGLRSGR